MRTAVFLVFLGLLLAGCVTTEEQIARMQQADDAQCRAMGSRYNACIAERMQLRQLQFQQAAANGAAMQQMGAALMQAAQPQQPVFMTPQMRTTQCQRNGIYLQCNTF